jgi:hypothetical protein
MSAPTPYERQQLKRITEWRAESPDFATRWLGKALSPAAQAVQRAIPVDWLRGALAGVQKTSSRLADQRSVLKRAGVDSLDALRAAPLERCDQLATGVARRGTALAGGSGALFGVAGAAGLIADVPTLLVQAFRVIHRTGLCYGEDCADEALARLPIAIFALASANSMDEKQDALVAIEREQAASNAAVRDGLERAAERELAKEAAVFSIQRLSGSIAHRLGLAKASGSVPVIGALVGGAVNAWYLNEVATCARVAFQLRWLRRRHGGGEPVEAQVVTEALAGEAPPQRKTRVRRRPSPPSS